MSDESKAGPSDSGPKQDQVSIWKCLESNAQVLKRVSPTTLCPFQNLEGKCILDWTNGDVKTWLELHFPNLFSHLDGLDGTGLTTLNLDDMDEIKVNKILKTSLLKRVGILLRSQKREKYLTDGRFNDIMEERGKRCFDCHIGTHLEHVKRNLIVFFCQFFFQTLGETKFLRNTSAIRYMQFWFKRWKICSVCWLIEC